MLTNNCIGAVYSTVFTVLTLVSDNVGGCMSDDQIQLVERRLMQPDSIILVGSKGSMEPPPPFRDKFVLKN